MKNGTKKKMMAMATSNTWTWERSFQTGKEELTFGFVVTVPRLQSV